jgi:hypothetical protein
MQRRNSVYPSQRRLISSKQAISRNRGVAKLRYQTSYFSAHEADWPFRVPGWSCEPTSLGTSIQRDSQTRKRPVLFQTQQKRFRARSREFFCASPS